MTVEELIVYGKKYLHKHEVNMLLSHILNYDNLELYTHLDEMIDNGKEEEYKTAIVRLTKKEPIQYVLGNVNFYGYNFIVNENVLIPRFETEELVNNTLEYIHRLFSNDNIKVLDIGTGSGNIGITINKEMPSTIVTCSDVSDKALEVASLNAKRLGANINFINSDVLDSIDEKYDVIISNPPYISENEEIEDIVKKYEPLTALYAKNDGLYFYDRILSTCKKNLNDKFLIAFEIGMTQKDKIINIINNYFDNVIIECKKDLSLKDRMIFIYSKNSR